MARTWALKEDSVNTTIIHWYSTIPIKGCPVEEKDETIGPDGCRKFVATHIDDCERVLQRLEGVRLTFSGEKSAFGQSKIMVVRHLCRPYDRKLSPAKVEAISIMKHDCNSVTEVRRFLGAWAFYHIWIPHYAHVAELLYVKKGRKFEWGDEHTESVQKMKEALAAASALRKAVYGQDTLIYVTVDMSPTGIGWVINQEDDNGTWSGSARRSSMNDNEDTPRLNASSGVSFQR